jgi:flagellar biosynthesis/type III secretory pathway protein FliH
LTAETGELAADGSRQLAGNSLEEGREDGREGGREGGREDGREGGRVSDDQLTTLAVLQE